MNEEMHASGNPDEVRKIRERWAKGLNRRTSDPNYQESWYSQQCGACSFWLPLSGKFGNDYGACANAISLFDGRVRFEHDGCEAYVDAGRWVVAEDIE